MTSSSSDKPPAWKPEDIEQMGERAASWYQKLRSEIVPENFGRYVAIDSNSGDYAIGDDENEAEHYFIKKHGSNRQAVLFHIGFF